MKLAIDPWMIRDRSFDEVCAFAAEHGYRYLEFSPRDDFAPLFLSPRAGKDTLRRLKAALKNHGVGISSMWSVYHWADGDETVRQTAVRYFKEFVELAGEMECSLISSEFGGDPRLGARSESAFWRSMDDVVPFLEKKCVTMAIDPHPGDFVEDGITTLRLLRKIGSPYVKFLYSAPHSFFMGGNIREIMRCAANDMVIVRVADTYDHRVPVRYIVNPPGAQVAVHQHLNIGEGELDWSLFFASLAEAGYDGPLCVSVFAWPDRVENSADLMHERILQLALAAGLHID